MDRLVGDGFGINRVCNADCGDLFLDDRFC